MRDNTRNGHARENASFDPGNCFIQSLPGQFHDDKGDASSLISDEAALLLRGVGIEVNGDALSLSDEAAPLLRGVGIEVNGDALSHRNEAAPLLRGVGMVVNGCDTSREARLGGVKNIEQSKTPNTIVEVYGKRLRLHAR